VRAEWFRWAVRGAGLAVGVAAVLLVLQIGLLARDVLVLVFVAILLASALQPAVDRVRAVVDVPRGAVILGVYAAFFAAVAFLALIILPAAVTQFTRLAAAAPQYFESARGWAAGLSPSFLSEAATALLDAGQKSLQSAPPKPGEVVEAGLTVAQVVASIVTMLAVVFFWLVEHAQLQRYTLSFLPATRRAGAREAWDDIEERLGQWVRGQLTLMTAMAVATGVIYSVLGLPSALLLALIAGIAEAIPIVGPLLGAVPALAIAATISPELVVLVALAYLVIQFVESNVLVPIVMKHTVGLSAFLVIVSILVGAAIAGIPGAFLAVPLVAAFEVALERLQARETPVTQTPPEPEPSAVEEIVEEARETGRSGARLRPRRRNAASSATAGRPRRSARATDRRSATS
jgi:predicted PurR-regulated permease PerM